MCAIQLYIAISSKTILLIKTTQYRFIKHSSTSDVVMDAYNEFLLNSNKTQVTCAIFQIYEKLLTA